MIENFLFTIYLALIFIFSGLIYLKIFHSDKSSMPFKFENIKLLLHNKYHLLFIYIIVLITASLIILIPIGVMSHTHPYTSLITLLILCLLIGLGTAYLIRPLDNP